MEERIFLAMRLMLSISIKARGAFGGRGVILCHFFIADVFAVVLHDVTDMCFSVL